MYIYPQDAQLYRVAQKSENTQRFVHSKPYIAKKRCKSEKLDRYKVSNKSLNVSRAMRIAGIPVPAVASQLVGYTFNGYRPGTGTTPRIRILSLIHI